MALTFDQTQQTDFDLSAAKLLAFDEIRKADFDLSDEQVALREVARKILHSTARARAAAPLGHDAEFWQNLTRLGIPALAAENGEDADSVVGMAEAAILAQEIGRTAAPAPAISAMVAARAIARARTFLSSEVYEAVLAGESVIAIAPVRVENGAQSLVPDAAIADYVLALTDDGLELRKLTASVEPVPNHGGIPLGRVNFQDTVRVAVLSTGPAASNAFDQLMVEWRLLIGAALNGATAAALTLAVDFAKTRETRGIPIGALQGISFPLADTEVGVHAGDRLTMRAAWAIDHGEPDALLRARVAAAWSIEHSAIGTSVAAHTQGGLGFTTEADVSLFVLRAKGWGLIAGRPSDDYRAIGSALLTAE